MKSEIFETRSCELWLDEDNITHQVFKQGVEITQADAAELLDVRKKLLKGAKGPIFSDIRKIKSVSKRARDYGNNEEGVSITTAFGILVGSPISRMIGSFFLGVNKPPYPTRLFTSKVEAMDWLKGYIET